MIDVVVVNHNTQQLLKRLLDTLCWPESDAFKLYIADNGSSDGSDDFLKEASNIYRIEAIKYNSNIGYARAANELASWGSSPYLGILNADVWLTSTDIRNIEMLFKDRPDITILGPKQRDERDIIRHGGIFGPNEGPHIHRGWGAYDPHDNMYRDLVECLTVSGSAYFIRRTAWELLTQCPLYREVAPDASGALLPTRHYWEESFCSYHAKAHGMQVFYAGEISIGHTWHASSPIGGNIDFEFKDSKEYFRRACDHHGIRRD